MRGPADEPSQGPRMSRRKGVSPRAVVRLAAGTALALATALASGSVIATARSVAYCSIAPAGSHSSWAFRVGAPVAGATGTYAHGHGTLSGTNATGVICQVDRVRGASDRQIILSVNSPIVSHVGRMTYQGHLANTLVLHVRVNSSSDARCKVGTVGTLTMIATYNGIKDDEVAFKFPRACADHDHTYTGSRVVALVPV
jgi:hypothetical protein